MKDKTIEATCAMIAAWKFITAEQAMEICEADDYTDDGPVEVRDAS